MGIEFIWRIRIQNYLRRFDLVSPYRETVNMLSRMLTCYLTYSILLIREPDYLYQRLSSRDEVSQGTSCDGKRLQCSKVSTNLDTIDTIEELRLNISIGIETIKQTRGVFEPVQTSMRRRLNA
ncbi:hypothetical protein J6590_095004, partial [Homalodisca vitripennis]